ncbi:MAG TPA: pyridoxamine 5'-phosphate oxidase family protein [Polyangia bacterium]|nr:pyridoxamine 5'-phosphate oxidase family protein [Polyangia bacterium]
MTDRASNTAVSALAGPLAALPDDVRTLLDEPVIMHLGTRDAALVPLSILAFGLHRAGDGRELTVFAPVAAAGETLANLRDNGQLALTLVRPTSHRSIQIKGTWLGERRVDEADRAFLARYRDALCDELGLVGVPRSLWRRLLWWPSVALRFEVREVFVQTPGPSAGKRCGEAPEEGSSP